MSRYLMSTYQPSPHPPLCASPPGATQWKGDTGGVAGRRCPDMTGENIDRLQDYRGKRHFDATEEPRGDAGRTGAAPCFVVQIHQARRMHFDFRLEVDGVL